MAKGHRITEQVETFIAEVYHEHEDWSAGQVSKEVFARLRLPQLKEQVHSENPYWQNSRIEREAKARLDREKPWPGESAVDKRLRALRKDAKKKDKGRDKPWTLAACADAENHIPHDATPRLLDLWKLSRILGHVFTIREAQWASRLQGAVQQPTLLYYAARYAARERACEALGSTLDTADLDASLVFKSTLEHQTARVTATMSTLLPPDSVRAEEQRMSSPVTYSITSPSQAVETSCLNADRDHLAHQPVDASWDERWHHISEMYLQLPLDSFTFYASLDAAQRRKALEQFKGDRLSPEADSVYAMWLRDISRTDTWKGEPVEAHVATMLELRRLVTDEVERNAEHPPWAWPYSWTPEEVLLRYGLGKREKGGSQ